MRKNVLLFLLIMCGAGFSKAAVFTSATTGGWSIPATWTQVGVDADGIPDITDDVIIASGANVTLDIATVYCKTLTVNAGATIFLNSKKTNVGGNFTVNGTVSGFGQFYFDAPGTISGSAVINSGGDWNFYANCNIAAGTVISKTNYMILSPGVTVINSGNVSVSGISLVTGTWQNASGSSLSVSANISGTGILNASAVPNSVNYRGPGATSIRTSNSYYNLSFTSTTPLTVLLAGPSALTVAGNLLIGTSVTLNCNNLNINLGGSWTNLANISCTNMATVNFNGSGTQVISRNTSNEVFKDVSLTGSGSVQLARNLIVNGTTTLTSGALNPASFIYNQKGASWLANGGTISTGATGEIFFGGTVPQTIGGTVGATFGNLEISSTSTVSLGRPLTVAGTFTITGGTFDVTASNFGVTLGGNFIHNGGTFNTQTGTVTANGSAAQTFSGSATTTFYNITSNNSLGGVTVNSIFIINNLLQVNSRSFGTAASGSIILTATGTNTYARIGPLGAGASLVGTNWSIGSYVNGPATAYWQYLGTPVSGATLADWDNDNRFYMSGVSGNDGNACCPIFYSVRTYNTATNTYTNITTVSTSLTPGRGYMVWMADNLSSLTAPLPFDTKGTPNQGTVVRAVTAGGAGAGYNLVSNPYACPINFASVVASSVILGPNFLILQENGSYVTNPNGGVIAPAQGFMCIANSNGSMKVLETAKNIVSSPNIIRESAPQNCLTIISGNGTNGLGGSAVVQINSNAHNGYDADFDMPYLPSPYEEATNIWTTDNEGKDLLLNALDGSNDVLDIPLSVVSGTPGSQLLSFRGINSLESYSCAWIEDLATGEKINLKDHDTYSFNATEVAEKHNFNIHLERTATCPLNEQNITASLDASSLVFVNNGNILVQFAFEEKTDVTISVFDAIGQQVSAGKNVTVSNETIALDNPGAHGIYLVRITKGAETVTKKIYL